MIDLLAADDRAGFGLAAALAIEGIPVRRIARATEFRGRLLLLGTGADTPDAVALACRVPTLAVGATPALAAALFGVRDERVVEGPVRLPLAESVWPVAARATGARFGKDALALPRVRVLAARGQLTGRVLARLSTGVPAVVARGPRVWCAADLGGAFADLCDEGYAPVRAHATRRMPAAALALYYRAPEALRRRFQARVYRRLEAELETAAAPSDYPVDATGWLLVTLLATLVRRAAGIVVRLARWPAPFTAAAALTHDLEPSRYAYTDGLAALLARTGGEPGTLGVVALAAARWLGPTATADVAGRDVLCHGLAHRGETLADGTVEAIGRGIATARTRLESQLGRPVAGFRSPRLDRSPALLRALDAAGFAYDSSYPDVDRENIAGFGGGVRLTVPFRPPIDDAGRVRPSRCLELPVSAPDCIQPLFLGAAEPALRHAVGEKIAFVHRTGGAYVGIVHAGVFGPQDAEVRGAHLDFVRSSVSGPDVWRATAGEVAGWWQAREALDVRLEDGHVAVTNTGPTAVDAARVIFERDDEESVHALGALAAGATVRVALPTAAPARAGAER